jgi:SAM-dependent methyltransferase
MMDGPTTERTRPRLSRTLARSRWGEYRSFLSTALDEGYDVVALEDWVRGDFSPSTRTLVLRHDVDQHPRSALRMLAVEEELGVRATWYFRWRTAHPSVVERVRATGAGVGLHYETLTRLALERDLPAGQAPRLIPEARRCLRAEIAAFEARFGPIRSVCPHGDTRAPDVRNASLLEGEDCHAYGVEFDGNAAMRHHRPRYWLTDRLAADGRWARQALPSQLMSDGISPILCVIHPNNWTSGLTLWSDRLVRSLAQWHGLGSLVRRTLPSALSDNPPRSLPEFDALASELRRRIVAHYADQGALLDGKAGHDTLETNSGFVPRRAEPLVEILRRRAGYHSLAGISLADLGCGFGGLSIYFASLGADVVGLDLNGARLEVPAAICSKRGLPASFRQARMQRLPLPDDSVDVAVMNNSLCYVVGRSERQEALREAHRVLRPGGHLLVRNPNRWSPTDPFTSLPLVGLLPSPWSGRVAALCGRRRSEVTLVSTPGARRELARAGFRAVEDVPLPGRARPLPVRLVARYQHLLAGKSK